MTERTCGHCGGRFAPHPRARVPTLYCSQSCRSKAQRERDKIRTPTYNADRLRRKKRPGVARRKLERAARGTAGRSPLVAGFCSECGSAFTVKGAWHRRCSPACQAKVKRGDRSNARANRRARERSAFVQRVYRKEIFERDGWRCQLCHKKVNKHLSAPHPMSASLDHIIPLARGGTHEPSNCQLAHLTCNSTKSDRAWNDQLRLAV